MLVLSRRPNDAIVIGENIRIVITRVVGDRVYVGIEAPRDVPICREELLPEVRGLQTPELGGES